MACQVRVTLEEASKRKQDVDWAKVHATSEEDNAVTRSRTASIPMRMRSLRPRSDRSLVSAN